MKKKYMLMVMLVTSVIWARAQSSFTTIEFNHKTQPTLVLELPNTTEDVKGTILEKLKQTGYKPETTGHLFWKRTTFDGFYVFNNVVLPSLSDRKLDMYFKVVQKNKHEKNNSTVYLLISSGNENFAAPTDDTELWNSSQMFLNSFVEKTTAYSLEHNITTQEASMKKAQDKLAELQKDGRELEEKLRKNQEGQKSQQLFIENQGMILADLRLKRIPQ